jgi:para-aminobenzoate synthetase / 4-amino-4-deoxychorismate lyase
MTRVVLDFATASGPPQRLLFESPLRTIAAFETGSVMAALETAEEAARSGCWVAGFVAYEAAPAFDTALVTHPPSGTMPLLWFGVFDGPSGIPPTVTRSAAPLDWRTDTTRAAYDAAIHEIRQRIAAGEVYQVNHTTRFDARCDVPPSVLYDVLVHGGHGGYSALVESDEWAIVSASPELFFDLRDRLITTRPMKGTLRRGRWLEEDAEAAALLLNSAKDRAENLMIVDLLRNDIGRVARFGSVRVPALFAVETYPTVHQMTSTITAELRDDASICDVFAAMFPCGSVTGAPKVTAMRAIAELEASRRGPYCGAIGVMRPDGSATFNVAIRTLHIDRVRSVATYGAGGGITWDSRAGDEFDEVAAKAALLHEPAPDFDLIETMRCDDGSIPRLDAHLARLHSSAQYWGFAPDCAKNAEDALAAFAAERPAGSWRIRLTASRAGCIDIEATPLASAELRFDSPAEVRPVALANEAVSRHDRLLCHKTTARAAYEQRRARHPDAFDVLLVNAEGEVTEFTIGNVVAEIDGRLLTPPRDCGLLAGVMRDTLLREGIVHERLIAVEQLRRATRLWHVNSVRGCTPVQLVVTPP